MEGSGPPLARARTRRWRGGACLPSGVIGSEWSSFSSIGVSWRRAGFSRCRPARSPRSISYIYRNKETDMNQPLGDEALDQIFLSARTYNAWQDRPVGDDTLRQLYELMKWGPTSANLCPARILFLRTPEAKERLRPCVSPGNIEKTRKAPVTAI